MVVASAPSCPPLGRRRCAVPGEPVIWPVRSAGVCSAAGIPATMWPP